jgi:integrase
LSISYIKDTETKEEFIERKFKKTGSADTRNFVKSAIKKFEIFCNEILKVDSEKVIQDLTDDWTKTKDVTNCVNILAQFIAALQEDHPDVIIKSLTSHNRSWKKVRESAQRNFLSTIRMYLRARTGAKIASEDIAEKITIIQDDDDDEPEPVTLDQFNAFHDRCTIPRRKVKYLFHRDTGCRTHETVQITKSMITFDYDESGIALVRVPRRIVKAKSKGKTNFLTPEVAKKVKELCECESDDSSIFVDPKDRHRELTSIKHLESNAFIRERDSLVKYGKKHNIDYLIALDDRKESNQHKIVLHSIRAYCGTQYAKAHDEALGHGYIGHKKYLAQYMRYSDSEKLAMFKKAIPFLTGIEKEYGESELALKVKEVESQNKLLHRELENVKKNGLPRTAPAIDTTSNNDQVILELAKRYNIPIEEIVQIKQELRKVVIPKE